MPNKIGRGGSTHIVWLLCGYFALVLRRCPHSDNGCVDIPADVRTLDDVIDAPGAEVILIRMV